MAESTEKSGTAKVAANPAPNRRGKQAVIISGGKQYLVTVGEELEVEKLDPKIGPVFEPLLLIEGDKVSVGTPYVTGAQVKANIVEQEVKADKVISIRYKAKKRVHKRRGHRQKLTRIKITSIG